MVINGVRGGRSMGETSRRSPHCAVGVTRYRCPEGICGAKAKDGENAVKGMCCDVERVEYRSWNAPWL